MRRAGLDRGSDATTRWLRFALGEPEVDTRKVI